MQLTVQDVCQFLKTPESRVQRWVREGGLTRHRVSGQVCFSRSELSEGVTLHRIEMPPELPALPRHKTTLPPGRSWTVKR